MQNIIKSALIIFLSIGTLLSQSDCIVCDSVSTILQKDFGSLELEDFETMEKTINNVVTSCPSCNQSLYNLWETALYQARIKKDIQTQKIALSRYKEAYTNTKWNNDTLAFDMGLTVKLREGYYYRNLEDYNATSKIFQQIIDSIKSNNYYNYSIHGTKNIAYQNIANIEKKRANWNKALSIYQYAIDDELVYAKESNRAPVVFSIYAYIGEIYALQGNDQAAYYNYEIANQVLIQKMKTKTSSQMRSLVYQYLQRFLGQIKPAIKLKRWEDVQRLFSIIEGLPLIPDNAANIDVDFAKLDYHIAINKKDSVDRYFKYITKSIEKFSKNQLQYSELLTRKIDWYNQFHTTDKVSEIQEDLNKLIEKFPKELEKVKIISNHYQLKQYQQLNQIEEAYTLLNNIQNDIYKRLSEDLMLADHLHSVSDYYKVLETGLDLLYEQENKDYSLIFKTIECTKSLKLLSTYRSSVKRRYANDTLVSEYKYFNSLVASANRKQNENPNDPGIKKELFELKEKLSKIKEELSLKKENINPIVDLNDFRKDLNRNELYLSFFSGKENNYLLYISADSSELIRIPTKKIEAASENLYTLLSEPSDIKELHRSSNQFLNLIDPKNLISKFNQLKISTDNYTNSIPFEGLSSSNGKYLIENHDIYYTPSAYMDIILKDDNNNIIESVSIFSPSFSDNKLLYLPYAKSESEFISNEFPTKLYEGQDASIQNFSNAVKSSDIIHLITHGLALDDNPSLYYIALSGKSNQIEKLYFDDISSYSITANMVCLSACQTGKGKNTIGEGNQSLARNFMAAGCNTVISSAWNVSDQSTSEIYQSFYKFISQGSSKVNALSEAKRLYLKSHQADEKHPYYWAGIVLTGDGALIAKRKSARPLLLITFGLLSFLGLYYLVKNFT